MIQLSDSDRRKFPRVPIRDATYISFRPSYQIIGQLKDVSQGGLSFEYVNLDNSQNKPDDVPQTLDIIRSNQSFHLSGLPYEIVYDRPLPDRYSLIGLESRVCGLKFISLTPQQQKKIDTLIQVEFLKQEETPSMDDWASA